MASRSNTLGRLPHLVNVAGHGMVVHLFQTEQIPAAYRLVCAEAGLGKDIGQDEFPSESHLLSHIQRAHSFSFTDTHTGALRAFLTLAPSAYSRMMNPLLADGIIICDVDIKARVIQGLIQVALNLATDLGYEGVLADVFSTSDLVARLRSEGFTVIGCIPNSGHLHGRGWTDSLVMFKDVKSFQPQVPRNTTRALTPQLQLQPLSSTESTKSAAGGSVTDGQVDCLSSMACLKYFNQKPHITYLPRTHTFSTGTKVTLRYMRDEDLPAVYNMYREAARRGDGFSTDEFQTLDIFRFYVIDHGHPIVGEDIETSKIVIAASILPCVLCRSVDPLLADPYLVVDPRLQSRGIGLEVSDVLLRFIHELGYAGVLADCLADNLPMVKIMRKNGFAIVGYIPKAAKGKDQKVADCLLFYKDLEGTSNFESKL